MNGPFPTGLLPEELVSALSLSPGFRGTQVFKWISRGATGFGGMSDLGARERERLSELFPSCYGTTIAERLEDDDGSVKLKLSLRDGSAVEAVLLVDAEGRKTACVSTQVGCPMDCGFCKTGSLGFLRNLEAYEIVEQYLHLAREFGRPSNLVFMGMGEPLLNLGPVRAAIRVLSHEDGINLSGRKITISTCGLVPGILDLADNGPPVRLAVSLTSADDDTRSALMPVNRTWNLASLKEALLHFQERTNERITLEAALMGDRNCDIKAARDMAAWIRPLDAQVNLIPWNPVPGFPFKEPTRAQVEAFERELVLLGINVSRRAKRGRGVQGACGQLGDTLS